MDDSQRITIELASGEHVSGLWRAPASARAVFVFAHGAGAGMTHAFMHEAAAGLAERRIATLRYQFAYMERGSKRPDAPALAHAAVRAAVATAAGLAPGVPVIAGGKSFGGRMTSQAQAAGLLPAVRGLAFFGFPLHPAGKPAVTRAEHLQHVSVPMLFLQGTRDELAELALLQPIVAGLGERARLHLVDDADHGFHVRARSGRNDSAALAEMLDVLAAWAPTCAAVDSR